MHHPQVARVVPATAERLGRRCLVVEVAEHHVVAPQNHLTERLAVGRHIDHLLVHYAWRLCLDHGHTLSRFQLRALLRAELIPSILMLVDRKGPIHLGEAVDMHHVNPERLQLRNHRRRRGRPSRRDPEP